MSQCTVKKVLIAMQLLELMVAMLRSCIYLNERANTMERAMLFLVTLSCFQLMRPGEAGKCHAAHQLHILKCQT